MKRPIMIATTTENPVTACKRAPSSLLPRIQLRDDIRAVEPLPDAETRRAAAAASTPPCSRPHGPWSVRARDTLSVVPLR